MPRFARNPARLLPSCLLFLLPLSAGLAQVTESPHTIAPGRIRFEMDGIRVSLDRADAAGNTYSATAVASTIVSTGLTDTVDLQAGIDLFVRQKVEFRGLSDRDSGLGDLLFRVKWTFWKDERRGIAWAVIPYVRIPSRTGGIAESQKGWGFIVPAEFDLGGGAILGAMFQSDHTRDPNGGYDAAWTLSAYVSRPLTKRIGVYAESGVTLPSSGFSDAAGSIGAGVTYHLFEHLWFDYQLDRGLGDQASAWTHTFRVNWEW